MTVFTPLWGYWAWRERSSSKSNKNTQSGVKKGSTYIIIVVAATAYWRSRSTTREIGSAPTRSPSLAGESPSRDLDHAATPSSRGRLGGITHHALYAAKHNQRRKNRLDTAGEVSTPRTAPHAPSREGPAACSARAAATAGA